MGSARRAEPPVLRAAPPTVTQVQKGCSAIPEIIRSMGQTWRFDPWRGTWVSELLRRGGWLGASEARTHDQRITEPWIPMIPIKSRIRLNNKGLEQSTLLSEPDASG